MVFRGRPSKACQRCRDRKLKCDFHRPSCTPCLRAGAVCAGYRDTQQLRIYNESHAVRMKALSRNASLSTLRSFPLSLEWQARETFFAHYVSGRTKAWDFLERFYHPMHSPEHLTLSIDAASLAFLAHQVYSDAALTTARERYVVALATMNKALQSPKTVAEDTTLLTSFLLDLFEKITNSESRKGKSWSGHVNGALALVSLRGLEKFQDPSTLRMLAPLSTNILITCIASESPVPREFVSLRAYTASHLNLGDPKWQISDLMVQYANLRSNIRRGILSIDTYISNSIELDAKLQAFAFDVPSSWQYKSTNVDFRPERIYNRRFDSYPNRHVTQMWNVLRLIRILLNEYILEYCLTSTGDFAAGSCQILIRMAKNKIETLACEICASVPQYIDCHDATRVSQLSPEESTPTSSVESDSDGVDHTHSPSQNGDCYGLIFPLYVSGRSRGAPNALKPWVIRQLRYIASHFGIRNANLVSRILERETETSPWTVYALLGSYAFAA